MAESFSYPGAAAAQEEAEESPDDGPSSVLTTLQVTSEKYLKPGQICSFGLEMNEIKNFKI